MIRIVKRIFLYFNRYFQQKRLSPFRLLGWSTPPKSSPRLIIWILATDKFVMHWTAQEVYETPALLAKFSAEDIKIIVSLICKNQMPAVNKYRLVHTAVGAQAPHYIKLYAEGSQAWLVTTLTEISENPQLAASLEGMSAFELGQRYREHQHLREQEMMKSLRKTQYIVVKKPRKSKSNSSFKQ